MSEFIFDDSIPFESVDEVKEEVESLLHAYLDEHFDLAASIFNAWAKEKGYYRIYPLSAMTDFCKENDISPLDLAVAVADGTRHNRNTSLHESDTDYFVFKPMKTGGVEIYGADSKEYSEVRSDVCVLLTSKEIDTDDAYIHALFEWGEQKKRELSDA